MFPTGYGKQLALIQRHLHGKYHMAHICDYGYEGPAFSYNGVKVYGVAEYPGQLTTNHMDECIANFLNSKPIDKWIIIGLGNLHNRGILESYPSLLLSPVETEELLDTQIHSISCSIPIAISEFGRHVIQKYGFECPFLIPHAVDTEILPPISSLALRSTKDWPFPSTKDFVVGFFGDLSSRKSPKVACEVWRKFSADKPTARLWIHHSNHIDMDHKALADFLQMPNVHVTTTKEGWDDKQILEKLKTLDCLLHPSKQEAFGVFQAEAQCVGTPVVSYLAGPAAELNMHSQLVSPNANVDELTHRLEYVYAKWTSKDFALNSQIQTSANHQFSPEVAFKELTKAIDYGFRSYYPKTKHSTPRKMKHICIISTWGIDCGIATYTKMLADTLCRTHKITILAEGGFRDTQLENKQGIEVIHCWDRRYPSHGSLKGVIESLTPDIVHIQHETSLFKMQGDLMESFYDLDAKIVTTLHTPDFSNKMVVSFSSEADLTIVHNNSLAERMNGSLPNAIVPISHGAKEISPTNHSRDETGVPKGIPLFFNFGFCSPTKGVLELIRAAKMLKKGELVVNDEQLTTTHFELVIYASKSNKDYYKRCVKEASDVDGITLSDEILPEEGIDFWATQSDFIVFPYSPSGHPFQINSTSGALMRVLSAGKPLLTTDEGRLRDIIGGVHGWKCAMGSVEGLALSIHTAVNQFNYSKKAYNQMSENVLSLAKTNAWPSVGQKHLQSYKKIASYHHYRTKNPVLSPQPRKQEVQMLLEGKEDEEE